MAPEFGQILGRSRSAAAVRVPSTAHASQDAAGLRQRFSTPVSKACREPQPAALRNVNRFRSRKVRKCQAKFSRLRRVKRTSPQATGSPLKPVLGLVDHEVAPAGSAAAVGSRRRLAAGRTRTDELEREGGFV